MRQRLFVLAAMVAVAALAGCGPDGEAATNGAPAGEHTTATVTDDTTPSDTSPPATLNDPSGRFSFATPPGWKVGTPTNSLLLLQKGQIGRIEVYATAKPGPASVAEDWIAGASAHCPQTTGPLPITFDGVAGVYARGSQCQSGFAAEFAASVIVGNTVYFLQVTAWQDADGGQEALTTIAATWHWS